MGPSLLHQVLLLVALTVCNAEDVAKVETEEELLEEHFMNSRDFRVSFSGCGSYK